jgi:hypothetical protein
MGVMQVSGRTEKPFLADFPLIRAGRHVRVRLPAGGTLNVSVRNVALHAGGLCLLPPD